MDFLREIWAGFRPYLLRYTIDFLVSATIWLGLFLFKLLTSILQISGIAADFVMAIHALGTVCAMVIFVWFSVNDTIQVHRTK